jgi:hypothetical protein
MENYRKKSWDRTKQIETKNRVGIRGFLFVVEGNRWRRNVFILYFFSPFQNMDRFYSVRLLIE